MDPNSPSSNKDLAAGALLDISNQHYECPRQKNNKKNQVTADCDDHSEVDDDSVTDNDSDDGAGESSSSEEESCDSPDSSKAVLRSSMMPSNKKRPYNTKGRKVENARDIVSEVKKKFRDEIKSLKEDMKTMKSEHKKDKNALDRLINQV